MIFDMRSRTRQVVAGVLALAFVGAGVGGAIAAATSSAGTTVPTVAPPAAAVKASTVPASVKRAETAAEDVISNLEKGLPAKSKAEAQLLRSLAHGRAAADLRSSGVPALKVGVLQQRADRVAQLSAAGAPALDVSLAANDVSRMMPSLYAHYTDPVPPAVLKLDYLEREIQLQSQATQPARERAAVNSLRATWAKVRPWLVQAGGAKVAIAYDAHVKALGAAAQPAALQQEAVKGLGIVDQIEAVFLGG
ncbi:MAG: hypothetical protein QOJ57_1419 [Thermoleophilaceae bacterium]|nr:hypothetical protein [Thermoleophilaceae bacterium]